MPEFEISIYNMEVVEALESGKRHKDLDDRWAETHVIEFNARDEAGVRRNRGIRRRAAISSRTCPRFSPY